MEERAKSITSENTQDNRKDAKSKISEIMLRLSQNEKNLKIIRLFHEH